MSDCLTDIRQNLAAPKLLGKQDSSDSLSELLNNTETSVLEQIKSVLANLQVSWWKIYYTRDSLSLFCNKINYVALSMWIITPEVFSM